MSPGPGLANPSKVTTTSTKLTDLASQISGLTTTTCTSKVWSFVKPFCEKKRNGWNTKKRKEKFLTHSSQKTLTSNVQAENKKWNENIFSNKNILECQ
jgi:hypothetical protein